MYYQTSNAVPPNDHEIVELYWQRNERAIEATDVKYGKYLYNVSYNILGDKGESEECKNDTYLGIWNSIPPNRPQLFQAFITKIIRRISINRYKAKTRQKRVPSELTIAIEELQDELHSAVTPEELYTAKEVGEFINEFVSSLSKKDRYIFISRFYVASSIDNIANELGLTASSVYKAIGRIKRDLKQHLTAHGVYI